MVIQSVFYAFTFWMGVYLIARDMTSPRLRWAGLGLVAYALAIALDLMASLAAGSGAVSSGGGGGRAGGGGRHTGNGGGSGELSALSTGKG